MVPETAFCSISRSATPSCSSTFADTGIGIAPEHLDKLFEPFERLGAEQTDVDGTGLGLALSKGLIEAMGGTIEVQSAVGVGTTFVIELAAAQRLAGARQPTPGDQTLAELGSPDAKQPKTTFPTSRSSNGSSSDGSASS